MTRAKKAPLMAQVIELAAETLSAKDKPHNNVFLSATDRRIGVDKLGRDGDRYGDRFGDYLCVDFTNLPRHKWTQSI